MNSMVTRSQSELAHPALRAPQAGVRPALPTDYRLTEIASDVAMLVAVLALVVTFVALQMTLFAPPSIIERVAIPVAAGAAVVFLLALAGSMVLRYGDAPGPNR